MQRHDHIDLIDALISGDVAVQEGQVLKSKLLAQAVAERNDIFFKSRPMTRIEYFFSTC